MQRLRVLSLVTGVAEPVVSEELSLANWDLEAAPGFSEYGEQFPQ